MNKAIEDFIGCRRIAVVGASRNPKKFGYNAFRELAARGYEVIPIHPEAEHIAGVPCRPNLAALKEPPDGVLIVLPPQKALEVLRHAAAIGVQNVWLQRGAESPEVLALARSLGLQCVAGKCVLMYAPPVAGFHKFHRVVTKLTGRL